MVERETRTAKRRMRCCVAVRIAFALAALTPATAAGAQSAPVQLMPASAASVVTLASGEPPRDAAEWEHLRRHHATH
jgi:hypothetical protein